MSAIDGDLTYAELRDRAQRVAGALASLGVAPGDRVATMLPPSLDYLAAWFGVVWAGAVDVPVNVDFKGEFLRHVVGGSGAKVLIVDARWLERLDGLELPGLRAIIVAGGAGEAPGGGPAMTIADALAHAPVPRVRARRVRPRLPDVHLRHDRAVEGGDALEPERALERPLLDRHPAAHRERRRLLDVPALPRHRALGGRDLGDLGGRADRAARRLLADPVLGRRARERGHVLRLHGRRDPPPLGATRAPRRRRQRRAPGVRRRRAARESSRHSSGGSGWS